MIVLAEFLLYYDIVRHSHGSLKTVRRKVLGYWMGGCQVAVLMLPGDMRRQTSQPLRQQSFQQVCRMSRPQIPSILLLRIELPGPQSVESATLSIDPSLWVSNRIPIDSAMSSYHG